MISDGVVLALALAGGLVLAWVAVWTLHATSRGFRRAARKIKCRCGFHAPSGTYEPAPGARDVMRCLYCDDIVNVVGRTKNSLRRIR